MNGPRFLLQWLPIFLLLQLFQTSNGDIGTAAQYSPPYTPTACYGNDMSQFPTNYLFAAAGEGIWDNGAACGRQYLVRCISTVVPRTCVLGQTILVRIVDHAPTSGSRPSKATMLLCTKAFGTIANPSVSSINVEYQMV